MDFLTAYRAAVEIRRIGDEDVSPDTPGPGGATAYGLQNWITALTEPGMLEATANTFSRTLVSLRSPWYVNACCAPPSASCFAIAQAIERLFATPRISPRLPSYIPVMGRA